MRTLPIEVDDGERRYARQPVDSVTPEVLFERAWVQAVLDQTLARLDAEGAGDLKGDRVAQLRPYLTGDGSEVTNAAIAAAWGVGEPAVRVALHRLRRRFGALLREAVGRTVADAGDWEAEVRHLLTVASRAPM